MFRSLFFRSFMESTATSIASFTKFTWEFASLEHKLRRIKCTVDCGQIDKKSANHISRPSVDGLIKKCLVSGKAIFSSFPLSIPPRFYFFSLQFSFRSRVPYSGYFDRFLYPLKKQPLRRLTRKETFLLVPSAITGN